MSENKKWIIRLLRYMFWGLTISLTAGAFFSIGHYVARRGHGNVKTESFTFTESSRFLRNPNRGFYYMYGFMISEEPEDYQAIVASRMGGVQDMTLAMVHVNLQKYNDRALSEAALENIDKLFRALDMMDRQYLVRFLYDWEGNNEAVEPQDVSIILTHIKQVEDIFHKYQHLFFVHQGLFIGNWGEMNGTKHLEHMQALAIQLAESSEDSIYLGVRMPMQWRICTDLEDPSIESLETSDFAYRLSLYNDGMLGNIGDYGTYGTQSKTEVGMYGCWNREEELAFQEELCKYVPNGGEVIVENPVNDFDNALRDMKTMHVTYINRDYDQNVLNKWAETIIHEDGCFDGMDGLTYMERHLGYRFHITDTKLEYQFKEDVLGVDVTLQNVGFAPIYKETEIYITLRNENTGEYFSYPVEHDIYALTGGNDAKEQMTVSACVPLTGYDAGVYRVYFYMKDVDSDKHILLANEQDETEYGYEVGKIEVESWEKYLDDVISGR